ncbi:PREDICTED: PIN2/TERF1-interacting telomerase inhibitor 1 [Chrysochloris asiatica]|uniref:PIN2/TERF1-interacting telomerase inhibitor 1 n=1 Tax=Chrysochloris asiatica TaxID=185453 RepID=A0A9B0TI31_CHRAS|nr:PREDICTED: PIN2/TERF1-interacting telomerase inhibitor 1 [Chrysochloris asiatica]
MSMLAERRRKQKWAVDPRNTAWSNDDSKFGQRMLEKMGWSKGKGLGAQEQGATDHIKVQVKNNNLGLGATINNEDNWIAHQDDFNQLLAELNTCHGQETTDSSDNKEKKSFSLEEKSKISKNRVHYMKFTKGKDLSSRSKTDLDCIFGKRQSKKTPKDDSCSATPEENETSTTTTSALTIQEYFAKRMAKLQSKPQVAATDPESSEAQIEWKRAKKRKSEVKDKNLENNTKSKAKRLKKEKPQEEEENPMCVAKKKRDQVEQQLRDPCCDENSVSSASNGEDCVWPPDDQDCTPKPKKRKQKKRLKKQVEAVVDPRLHETPVKKKKKKKKGSK